MLIRLKSKLNPKSKAMVMWMIKATILGPKIQRRGRGRNLVKKNRKCCTLRRYKLSSDMFSFDVNIESEFYFYLAQVNHIRNKHCINVHGKQPPDPIENFDQLLTEYGVPQQIVNNLISCGYQSPTPIQMQAIPIMASVSCNIIGFVVRNTEI